MGYDGAVRVGGPPQQRSLGGLHLTKMAVGPMANNAYLLRCTSTGRALLIDAADEAHRLLGIVEHAPLDLIVTTHGHADHWQALVEMAGCTGAAVAGHPLDAGLLPLELTHPLIHGDRVPLGDAELVVIHLRGHTAGSIALVYTDPDGLNHIFSGDSLFPGGVGNTRGDEGAFDQLFADVTTRIFDRFPDDTWIYPGHGGDTTLGRERPHLGQWRERRW